jgi:hypothetical protein
LPVERLPPINSVGDRVTNCLRSFALNSRLSNDPANRDLDVGSCANNRSDKPKTLDRRAIFDVFFASIFALIFAAARHLLATVLGSARPAERGFSARGRLQWPKS